MKVLNLRCASGQHAFEGWFAAEADYADQAARGLLTCPMCGDADIVRLPSAPRLHLARRQDPAVQAPTGATKPPRERPTDGQGSDLAAVPPGTSAHAVAAFWRAARAAVQSAEDVGPRFADEARRMHHGETEERGIRGQATAEDVRSLAEEGIPVVPVPAFLKESLQ